MDGVSREFPRYKCHKIVHALKIREIVTKDDGSVLFHPSPSNMYAPFHVTSEYMEKHKPESGGYYVVYEDGYKSFSPADAFEGGYTQI